MLHCQCFFCGTLLEISSGGLILMHRSWLKHFTVLTQDIQICGFRCPPRTLLMVSDSDFCNKNFEELLMEDERERFRSHPETSIEIACLPQKSICGVVQLMSYFTRSILPVPTCSTRWIHFGIELQHFGKASCPKARGPLHHLASLRLHACECR